MGWSSLVEDVGSSAQANHIFSSSATFDVWPQGYLTVGMTAADTSYITLSPIVPFDEYSLDSAVGSGVGEFSVFCGHRINSFDDASSQWLGTMAIPANTASISVTFAP